MEVRLLGPVEIRTASGPQRLPGRAERALLALQALSAGKVVPRLNGSSPGSREVRLSSAR
jgi:hypothetical protein